MERNCKCNEVMNNTVYLQKDGTGGLPAVYRLCILVLLELQNPS